MCGLRNLQGAEERKLGTAWASLSDRDEAHMKGLLDLITSTGDLEV